MADTKKISLFASRFYRAAWVCAAVLTASGCADPQMGDLETFILETRKSQKSSIPPLPQFKPYETFVYSAQGVREPFVPWVNADDKKTRQASNQGFQPDFNRRKEPLEKFPLDALRMVGTMTREDGSWAIVRAPDGMVYRVREGSYVGQNHGRIMRLGEQRITVEEIVPDGLGGWQKREASLTLEG